MEKNCVTSLVNLDMNTKLKKVAKDRVRRDARPLRPRSVEKTTSSTNSSLKRKFMSVRRNNDQGERNSVRDGAEWEVGDKKELYLDRKTHHSARLRNHKLELFEVIKFWSGLVRKKDDKENEVEDTYNQKLRVDFKSKDGLWISKRVLRFRPCRPYEESHQYLHVVNQSRENITFVWTVFGDPRSSFSDSTPQCSSYTNILQEKPFFKQPNMKFDPVIYSVGPVIGSEKMPLSKSWFISYRNHRQMDNYNATTVVPMNYQDFLANYCDPNLSDNEKYQLAVASLFRLDPWSKTLLPLESVRVRVTFQPWFNTQAHAQLLCRASNGITKNVYLFGPWARVSVQIHPKYVEFGECLYDAFHKRTIQIKNQGRYSHEFTISAAEQLTEDKLFRPDFDQIYVSSNNGKIKANAEIQIEIYYLPGKPGRFVRHFVVNVVDEPPIKVSVQGRAIYHRVDIDLPEETEQNEAHRNVDKMNLEAKQIAKWAQLSQKQAQKSNIKKGFALSGRKFFRPFEGLLNFAKLPEHILDFGLFSTSDPEVYYVANIVNPGNSSILFSLVQTNDPLRKKMVVTFNRHTMIKPGECAKVTFSFKPTEYAIGKSECRVPFSISNGPVFTVVCKVWIEEPKLEMRFRCSNDNFSKSAFICRVHPHGKDEHLLKPPLISFNKVRCGFCSVVYMQLVNPGPVAAKWNMEEVDLDYIRKAKLCSPKEKLQLKAERESSQVFKMFPESGMLEPNERSNLRIEFSPLDDAVYNFAWCIKLNSSRHQIFLQTRGWGVKPHLEFSTQKVTFETIFPYMNGSEKTILVHNPCPFPVEFYCRELDKQHIFEDEIIANVEEFEQQHEVKFPVRSLGETIPVELIDYFNNNINLPKLAAAPTDFPVSDIPNAPTKSKQSTKQLRYLVDSDVSQYLKDRFPKKTLLSQFRRKFATKREMYRALHETIRTPLDHAIAKYQGTALTTDLRKEQFKKGIAIIIHGPPSSGKTALATTLSKYYHISLLKLNNIIQEAVENPVLSIHHKTLNFLLNPSMLLEHHVGTARNVQTPSDDGKARDTRPKVVAKTQTKSMKQAGFGKNQIGQPDSWAKPRVDPELAFQSKPFQYKNYLTDENAELLTSVIPEDLLVQLIMARLYRQDCRRGVVFDDLRCDFVENYPSAVKAILLALENRKRIYSFVLLNSFKDYRRHRIVQKSAKKDVSYSQLIRKIAKLRRMPTTDYICLRKGDRRTVDENIHRYVTIMRQMRNKSKQRKVIIEAPKPDSIPTELLNIPGGNNVKVTSSVRLPTTPESQNDEMKRSQYREGHYGPDNTNLRPKTVIRAATARYSMLKTKAKTGLLGSTNGILFRPRRDCWGMIPKYRADGSIQAVYRTEIYKSFKMFFTTLKDYNNVIMKWNGVVKAETKKRPKLDAQKEQVSATAKKRSNKGKDTKFKPRERSEAERADRDRAAIERAKNRCRHRRLFGVKHVLIWKKNVKFHDGRLTDYRPQTKRWGYLPTAKAIDDATKSHLTIPRSILYTLRTKPVLIRSYSDADHEDPKPSSHFQFVAEPGELPSSIPSPLLALSRSKANLHVAGPNTSDRALSAREQVPAAISLPKTAAKADSVVKTKSVTKHRPIASAMPRDASSHRSQVSEPKATTPIDLSLVYPSYNKAKEFSETKSIPRTHFRWSLPPNGTTTLRIHFQSNEEGKFQHEYVFEIVDYPLKSFKVSVRGICRYASLFENLAKIFPPAMWVDRITDERIAPVYVENERRLFLGPLLAGKKKIDILSGHVPQNIFTFRLKNPHRRTLSLHFNIAKRPPLNPRDKNPSLPEFTILPDQLVLRYQEEQIVKIFAHPTSTGKSEDILYAFTEYNPCPTVIILSCIAVKPQAEIAIKNIVIEKVPVRETGFGNIEVKNKTLLLPIRWKLLGIDQLPPEFSFEFREGLLKAIPETQFIPVKFLSPSERAVNYSKKPFKIEFYSEDSDIGTLQSEVLTISGESYDLLLDITFPKSLESVLDFGLCKINDEIIRQIILRNKGRSECGFQFTINFDELLRGVSEEEKLKTIMEFQPASGIITSSDRPVTINVVFKPTFPLEIKQKNIVKCVVFDTFRNNQQVAEIPIKTNLNAQYAKFVILPTSGDMRFPCGLPMQKRIRTITLQNVGDHEFSYVLKKLSSSYIPGVQHACLPSLASKFKSGQENSLLQASSHTAPGQLQPKSSTSVAHSSRMKDSPGGLISSQGGPFTVRPILGTVKVSEVVQISIEFMSDVVGTHEESYIIDISNRDPVKFPSGITYVFSGETVVPAIDTRSLENIFLEHLVLPANVTTISEASMAKWLVERSVYFPRRKQFFTQYTFVGTKRKLRFRLSNPTNIVCPVTVLLKSVAATSKGSKNVTEGFILWDTVPTIIEPHQSVYITLLFTPTMAIRYQMALDVQIEATNLQTMKSSALAFELIGEAVLPNLRLLQPSYRDSCGQPCLSFPKMVMGTQQRLSFVLLNDTVLPVTLSMHIRGGDAMFQLIEEATNEAIPGEVFFKPREERQFFISFSPVVIGKVKKFLDICCLEGTCPDLAVVLKGNAIISDAELEGLPPIGYDARLRLVKGSQNEDIAMERFHLFFGDCKPGQLLKADFELTNNSGDWLRFEWSKLPETIEIIPKYGHIRPQSSIPLKASYKADDNRVTRVIPVNCCLSTITIPDTYDVENVWNSEKQSMQVLSEIRCPGADMEMASLHSADKPDVELDSDHSVKDPGKHDKKDHKKGTDAKKIKDKKIVKKESISDKHRKTTDKSEKVKSRKQSDNTREETKQDSDGRNDSRKQAPSREQKGLASSKGDRFPKLGIDKDENGSSDDQEKKILAPTPEPLCTIKPNTTRNIVLVVSSITGFVTYECSVQEILFKDTFLLEKRFIGFTLKNTSNVVLTYSVSFSKAANSCLAFLDQIIPVKAAGEKPLPKESEGKKSARQDEDDGSAAQQNVATKTEKNERSKHESARGLAAQSQEVAISKELSVSSFKRKRKASAFSSNNEAQSALQHSQAQKSAGVKELLSNVRRINAEHFRTMTSTQTADLTTAFSVEPTNGTISPGDSQSFTVIFRPYEVQEYLGGLHFQMENQDPRSLPLFIPIHATGKLPLLHINTIEESALQWKCVPGHECRTLVFSCIGIESEVRHRLILTNPTDCDYELRFQCQDPEDFAKPCIEFSKEQVKIAAGKQSTVELTFIPHSLGTVDSKWLLHIPSYSTSIPLIIDANVREPDVSAMPTVLEFKPLLPRMRKQKIFSLTNDETVDLRFNFDLENFKGYDCATWSVNPLEGIITAKSKKDVSVVVFPLREFQAELSLLCRIEKRSTPLRITLQHDVLAPSVDLVYASDSGNIKLPPDSTGQINMIDLGNCEIHVVYKINIMLNNNGAINAAFSADICDASLAPITKTFLRLSMSKGLIAPGKGQQILLVYSPKNLNDKLTGICILIQIEFGHRYVISLTNQLFNIDLDFSFDECDFGPVLISRDSSEIGSTVPLIITNQTAKPILLDLLTYTLPSCMAFEFLSINLLPGNSSIHTVMFLPTEVGHFSGSLSFLINGTVTKGISLRGEGVEMCIAVPGRMRNLQFLNAQVGNKSTLTLPIENHTKTEVRGQVSIQPKTTGNSQVKELLDTHILTVHPVQEMVLQAEKSAKVKINFLPNTRIPYFEGKIVFTTNEKVTRELASLSGSCPGVDVILEERTIDFGSLVLHGSLRKCLVMRNSGELGAYFTWDVQRLLSDFVIKPKKGYIQARGEVVFEVTFTPRVINPDIRTMNLECQIPFNRQQIKLSLLGSCVPMPTAKDTVTFECPVRQSDAKQLSISNTTAYTWELRPELQGESWNIPALVTIKPNSTDTFEVQFKPLTGGIHHGHVNIILPTGQAVVFNLVGKTLPPRANGKIIRDIPCRVEHREKLVVINWLNHLQSYQVITEYIKPDKPDPSISVTGRTVLYIPALSQTEYEFGFKALRDKDLNSLFMYKITFKSEETSDYQFYEIQYKIVKGPAYDSRTLTSTVRTLKRETVRFQNPLETQIVVSCALQGASDVTIEPTGSIVIPPKKETEFALEYFPLRPGNIQARIDVMSAELGASYMELNLHATQAPQEQTVQFETFLGSTILQSCKLLNYSRFRADFFVKVVEGASDFQLTNDRATYSLPPGSPSAPTEQLVDIQYDPSLMCVSRGKLLASSTAAGEFIFPLSASCIQPRPKGPYIVTSTGEVIPTLEFRNPFSRSCAFNVSVSNRIFQVKEVTDIVKAKRTIAIPIGFTPNSADSNFLRGFPIFAQVVITPKFEGTVLEDENAEWVYYIKGEM